jgi:hypothetical protein
LSELRLYTILEMSRLSASKETVSETTNKMKTNQTQTFCGDFQFDGLTGDVCADRKPRADGRYVLYVDAPNGFSVIGTFANFPTQAEVEGKLTRKGLL